MKIQGVVAQRMPLITSFPPGPFLSWGRSSTGAFSFVAYNLRPLFTPVFVGSTTLLVLKLLARYTLIRATASKRIEGKFIIANNEISKQY